MQAVVPEEIFEVGELLALFPQEDARNKAAFFDYLCALDFI